MTEVVEEVAAQLMHIDFLVIHVAGGPDGLGPKFQAALSMCPVFPRLAGRWLGEELPGIGYKFHYVLNS